MRKVSSNAINRQKRTIDKKFSNLQNNFVKLATNRTPKKIQYYRKKSKLNKFLDFAGKFKIQNNLNF